MGIHQNFACMFHMKICISSQQFDWTNFEGIIACFDPSLSLSVKLLHFIF